MGMQRMDFETLFRPARAYAGSKGSRSPIACCCSRPASATTIPGSTFPSAIHKLFTHDTYNWRFESEPVAGLNGRTSYQPRGKMLGGTSSLNGMVYMRGTAGGLRRLAPAAAVAAGTIASVLPFFRKAEDQERGEDEFHGRRRPLKVTDPALRT